MSIAAASRDSPAEQLDLVENEKSQSRLDRVAKLRNILIMSKVSRQIEGYPPGSSPPEFWGLVYPCFGFTHRQARVKAAIRPKF